MRGGAGVPTPPLRWPGASLKKVLRPRRDFTAPRLLVGAVSCPRQGVTGGGRGGLGGLGVGGLGLGGVFHVSSASSFFLEFSPGVLRTARDEISAKYFVKRIFHPSPVFLHTLYAEYDFLNVFCYILFVKIETNQSL